MTYSIKKFNALAQHHGLELVKGHGYFYWITTKGDCPDINSVPTPHFNRLTKRIWLLELDDAVRQFRRGYRIY